MDYIALSLPEQKDYSYSYGLAFKLACEQLARVTDISELCRKSGCRVQIEGTKKIIELDYLNRTYHVSLPDIEIKTMSGEEVPLRDKILIAHYIINASGVPISDKVITYKEIKDGATYFPTFYKRAIKPLVDCFGKCPERLLETAIALFGGQKASYGDTAVTINAFSRVPVTLVLWKGDDEFPAEGSVFFDSTITGYLSTEDVTILCQTIAWMLVKQTPK